MLSIHKQRPKSRENDCPGSLFTHFLWGKDISPLSVVSINLLTVQKKAVKILGSYRVRTFPCFSLFRHPKPLIYLESLVPSISAKPLFTGSNPVAASRGIEKGLGTRA
jgi:hypothetical protein